MSSICYACNRRLESCQQKPCFSRQVSEAVDKYVADLGPWTPRPAKKVQALQAELMAGPESERFDYEW